MPIPYICRVVISWGRVCKRTDGNIGHFLQRDCDLSENCVCGNLWLFDCCSLEWFCHYSSSVRLLQLVCFGSISWWFIREIETCYKFHWDCILMLCIECTFSDSFCIAIDNLRHNLFVVDVIVCFAGRCWYFMMGLCSPFWFSIWLICPDWFIRVWQ